LLNKVQMCFILKNSNQKSKLVNQVQSITKLQKLAAKAEEFVNSSFDQKSFCQWRRDTEVAIEHIFGKETRHLEDFKKIRYLGTSIVHNSDSEIDGLDRQLYQSGLEQAIATLDSMSKELGEYGCGDQEPQIQTLSAMDKVELLIRRFHKVARQLQSRHALRSTIEINDEYDVQDLFESLLRIYFDDVRPEEFVPSYAGASSRVDFLLKEEKIIIEIKKTRKGLSAKEIGEQLIIDSRRYQEHPDCRQLICFVYDPEGRVVNPRGLENDLTKEINGVSVAVFITPDH